MTTEFKIIKDEDDYIFGCDQCTSQVPLAEFNDDRSSKNLCFFCAHLIGRASEPLLKEAFCQGLNVLLKELKK